MMLPMQYYRGEASDTRVGILSRVRFPPPPFTSSARPLNAGDFSAASARLRPTEADSEGPTRNSPLLAFLPQIGGRFCATFTHFLSPSLRFGPCQDPPAHSSMSPRVAPGGS